MEQHTVPNVIRRAKRLSTFIPVPLNDRLRSLGRFALNYQGARQFALRKLLFTFLGRYCQYLVAPFGTAVLLVDSADRQVGRSIFVRGDYERLFMESAISFLASTEYSTAGKTFVDVGANIGSSTIDALLRFGFSNAVCFEPDRSNFTLLRINLLLNGLEERATAHHLAISDQDRVGALRKTLGNPGDTRLIPGAQKSSLEANSLEHVPCASFDSLVAAGRISWDEVGMLWIDAQGHEAFILEGATSAFAFGVPTVIEYWPEGLKETDSLERLENVIRTNYDMVVDLRALCYGADHSVFRAEDIATLRKREIGAFTDLLLLQ